MKKLLVIPIIVAYYMTIAVPFLVLLLLIFASKTAEWLQNLADEMSRYLEDYIMKPFGNVYYYALQIMKSDKTIQWIKDASEKLKQGKPIN